MGKINGFLLYKRELPKKDSVQSRIQHHKEFQSLPSKELLNQQSARCMNCGVPFCMSGCPLGNIIPEFNDAVYNKHWKKAYNILLMTNNFPEFTGRICPAPCEGACVLAIDKSPITIEEIEKNIIEIAYNQGFVIPKIPRKKTGKKIAVVGSGPSGLAVADQLNQLGHSVVVFERDSHLGGLLRFGIPDFKLEKNIVERRIKLMEKEGIQFKVNINVGKEISAKKLKRDFDAIILAIGSTVPRDLVIPGRDAKGIYFAMEYLKQNNQKISFIPFNDESIDTKGKRVIVIGGGDTGSDCIGTANRNGAREVYQIEIMPIPTMKYDETTSWPMYSMLLKTTSSHEEGCKRRWSVNSKEFLKDKNGNLKGLRLIEVNWKKDPITKNYISFCEKPKSEFILPCDLVLLAMGFLHVEQKGLVEDLRIELDMHGNLGGGKNTKYQTSESKIFSCGDARRGQSLVVWAINEGRKCALAVNKFLNGQ